MSRWWWIWILMLTNLGGCTSTLPERTEEEQAVDRAVVAVAVGHRRNFSDHLEAGPRGKLDRFVSSAVRDVTVYLQRGGIAACSVFETWWKTLKSEDKERLPCQFRVERDEIPEWVTQFPTFYWCDANGKYWSHSGWNGIDAFLATYRYEGDAAPGQTFLNEAPNNSPFLLPARVNRSLPAGDWVRLLVEGLKSGVVPLNSEYAIWVPEAGTMHVMRAATHVAVSFEAPFPLLRLNWHGLRYDDSIRQLSASPDQVSITLGTFGKMVFQVQSPKPQAEFSR